MGMLLPRRPPHPNVLDIPTPPLQQAGVFVIFFFTALAFVTYLLRVYSRLKTKMWGLDDYLVTCGMVFSLMMVGPFYMYFKLFYFGWKLEDVPQPHDMTPANWWFFLAQLFYNPILAFVKASVLVFMLRLAGPKPAVRWTIHSLNIFNALQGVAIFLVALLQCLPIEANWDANVKMDPNTKCIDNSFHVIASCLTLLTDILVVAIPFWIFLGLKMKQGAKIAVLGIFLLGIVVFIIGCVRLNGLIKLFYLPPDGKDPYHDITVTLSVVEANVAITTACAPALRPLFVMWLPKIFGNSTNRYGNKYTAGSKLPYYTGPSKGTAGLTSAAHGTRTDRNGDAAINLRSMNGHKEVRSESPTGSEEEIMTYNGIMRTTDVRVQYDAESTLGHSRVSIDSLSKGDSGTKEVVVEKRTL